MLLNRLSGFCIGMCVAVAAFGQQPVGSTAPPTPNVHQLQQPDKTVTYVSAADVDALIDRAKKESTEKTPMVVGNLLKLAPYTVLLEYRPVGVPFNGGTHPKDAELFYVIDGSGTLTTGGTLAADHMSIAGGDVQKVSKGDFIMIPEGTPHIFSHVNKTLELMSIHIPRTVPEK